MSTTAPETVAFELDADQASHAVEALTSIIEKQTEEGEGAAPAQNQARSIISKLPEGGGTAELTLAESFRLELGLSIHDADYNTFAMMFGAFEPSSALTTVRDTLDSALDGVDEDSQQAVAERQNVAAGFPSAEEEALLAQPAEVA